MADTIEFTGLSLFSGVGMLDEAVGIALAGRGIRHRVAAFCEWEASAASLLLARMEEQSVEPCPVWCGDLADFPAESFAGRIDILTSGYPCQPYSVAGAKRGLRDHRALGEDGRGPIHHLLRIIGAVGPRFVFLENVWEAAKHFRPIGRRLVALGYEVAPPFLCGAGAVGASHRRERMFVLARRRIEDRGSRIEGAVADGDGIGRERRPGSGWEAGSGAEYGDETMADTVRERRQQIPGGASGDEKADGRKGWHGSESDGDHVAAGAVEAVADAECGGQGGCDGAEPGNAAAFDGFDGGEIPFFAPGPDSGEWPGILERWPWLAPATESGVCVVVDGVAVALDGARADSLRASGNGVVALAGAVAFEHLLRWTGWELGRIEERGFRIEG